MFHQKTFVSKSGKQYTFQFPGIRTVMKIKDRSKNKYGVLQDERVADEVLTHVIVEPKMKMDDFQDIGEFSEVINAAVLFMNGVDDEVDADANQQTGS